jgi:hypothetical protein
VLVPLLFLAMFFGYSLNDEFINTSLYRLSCGGTAAGILFNHFKQSKFIESLKQKVKYALDL